MVTDFFSKELIGTKENAVLRRVRTFVRDWPDRDFYPKIIFFLLRYSQEFKRVRTVSHLSRMIIAEYFYKRRLVKSVNRYPKRRHLYIKLLRTNLEYPFGSKSVLGITTLFNLMKEREVFEEQHMVEAIRRLVPEVRLIADSFHDFADKKLQVHSVYLEVEKEGGAFTLDEIRLLQEKLPMELKGCVEQLVPVTFMRRNEEEVYRNILSLRDQLKSVRDIPQATISFEEQTQFDIFFTVVVLRLVKEDAASVKTLFTEANPDILYIPDRVDEVGRLRKNYCKEATVFRLQLPKSQFFRKDRSVNLYTARKEVVARLVKALGPVRDYNGGLILKQNERLEDFISLMPKLHDEFFLENFFYSITPIAMQSILPAAMVKEWFMAFSELMEKEMDRSYLLTSRRYDEALIVVVRAEEESFKTELLAKINQLEIPSLELAFSEIRMNGSFCFGFLYRPSQFGCEMSFSSKVEEAMEDWSARRANIQILHLSLHDNDPTLDPRITKPDQSYIILKMLFEGLTRIGRDGKPHMALAQSCDISPDCKTYTFHLRDSKWSNGAKVTAHDFDYSWKKAISSPGVSSGAFYLIKNAKAARENKVSLDEVGIQVLDERTLLVELEHPAPYFLEATAHWSYSLINSMIDRKYPGWAYQAGENYVSNGPFRLVEWKHNRAITLEKNPDYWNADAVNLNKIEIALLGPGQDEMQMLKNGELDFVGRPMGLFPLRGMREFPETKRVEFPLQGNYTICFNTQNFPFNHKKLRQAFACAIDRQELACLMPHEFAAPSFSILPDKLSLSKKPLFPDKDLDRARALFREGLGEIGFVRSDFPRLNFFYCTGRHRESVLRHLVEQWKVAFGIEVHLREMDWKSHFDLIAQGKFQFGGIEIKALWNDPLHILNGILDNNLSKWKNEEYKCALDSNQLVKAEAILAEEMPMIPVYGLKGNYLKRDSLHGECVSEFFQIDFKWAYID